jgi:hypothetical protein
MICHISVTVHTCQKLAWSLWLSSHESCTCQTIYRMTGQWQWQDSDSDSYSDRTVTVTGQWQDSDSDRTVTVTVTVTRQWQWQWQWQLQWQGSDSDRTVTVTRQWQDSDSDKTVTVTIQWRWQWQDSDCDSDKTVTVTGQWQWQSAPFTFLFSKYKRERETNFLSSQHWRFSALCWGYRPTGGDGHVVNTCAELRLLFTSEKVCQVYQLWERDSQQHTRYLGTAPRSVTLPINIRCFFTKWRSARR